MVLPRVTVFEVANDERKELYVGVTTLPMHELMALPPAAIRHWDRGQSVFRSLEFDLDLEDARAFVLNYAKANAREGWRVLVDAP